MYFCLYKFLLKKIKKLKMMLVYEIFRYLYYYYHYLGICSDYSYLVAGLIVGDILWIMCSLYGFISIDSRNIKKMHELNKLYIYK